MSDENKNEVQNLLSEQQKFSEQCYLIYNLKYLASLNLDLTQKEPYKNFIMLDGSPSDVTQELINRKNVSELMQITPAQLALIVPHIRIFKVVYDKNSKIGTDIEMQFKDFLSPQSVENMLNNKQSRGDGVGIKSFSYTLAGRTVAEGGQAVCTLELFFQDINSLTLPQDKTGISYKDLILAGRNNIESNHRNYQLKIISGWSDPSDPNNILITPALQKAIAKSRTLLFLYLKEHYLDFREDGTLHMKLEYNAGIEGVLFSIQSDLLSLTKEGQEAKDIIKKSMQKSEPSTNSNVQNLQGSLSQENPLDDKLKNLTDRQREDVRQKETEDKQERYSRLLRKLYNSSKIFYIDVDDNQITAYNEEQQLIIQKLVKEGKINTDQLSQATKAQLQSQKTLKTLSNKKENPKIYRIIDKKENPSILQQSFYEIKNITNELTSEKYDKNNLLASVGNLSNNEKIDKKINSYLSSTNAKSLLKNGKRRVNFFYLGDLLNIALETLTDTKRDDNYNVKAIVGSIEIDDPKFPLDRKKRIRMNIADIPISLNLFITWYFKNVIASQKETYLIGSFIQDVLTYLIQNAINNECSSFSQNAPFVSTEVLTVPNNTANFQNGQRIDINNVKNNIIDNEVLSPDTHQEFSQLTHYLYIYASNSNLLSGLKGNEKEDAKKGIYHFTVGADKGLVRSITFHKNNQFMVSEARADNATIDQKRLAGLYDATIRMIGNSLFRPGSLVYINMNKLSPLLGSDSKNINSAKFLNLGGYYSIVKIDQHLSADENITELDARWIGSAEENNVGDFKKVSAKKLNEASEANEKIQSNFNKKNLKEAKIDKQTNDIMDKLKETSSSGMVKEGWIKKLFKKLVD